MNRLLGGSTDPSPVFLLTRLDYRFFFEFVLVGVAVLWILGFFGLLEGVQWGRGGPGSFWEGLEGVLRGSWKAPGGLPGGSWALLGGSRGCPGGVPGGPWGLPVGSWTDLGGSRASRSFPIKATHRFLAHLGPQRAPQDPPRWTLGTHKK